jgi:DNA repair exonuclease SbcCD ATPase subunit
VGTAVEEFVGPIFTYRQTCKQWRLSLAVQVASAEQAAAIARQLAEEVKGQQGKVVEALERQTAAAQALQGQLDKAQAEREAAQGQLASAQQKVGLAGGIGSASGIVPRRGALATAELPGMAFAEPGRPRG